MGFEGFNLELDISYFLNLELHNSFNCEKGNFLLVDLLEFERKVYQFLIGRLITFLSLR